MIAEVKLIIHDLTGADSVPVAEVSTLRDIKGLTPEELRSTAYTLSELICLKEFRRTIKIKED